MLTKEDIEGLDIKEQEKGKLKEFLGFINSNNNNNKNEIKENNNNKNIEEKYENSSFINQKEDNNKESLKIFKEKSFGKQTNKIIFLIF